MPGDKNQNKVIVVDTDSSTVQQWDHSSRKQNFSSIISKDAMITDFTFQPLNDYCAFALSNKSWSFFDITT